jgi:hypothetical protein
VVRAGQRVDIDIVELWTGVGYGVVTIEGLAWRQRRRHRRPPEVVVGSGGGGWWGRQGRKMTVLSE